jgi:hypothetical protein
MRSHTQYGTVYIVRVHMKKIGYPYINQRRTYTGVVIYIYIQYGSYLYVPVD